MRTVIITTAVVSQARRFATNSAKSTTYVHSRVPKDTAKPIPDDRITPPDHGVPPGPFPSSSSANMYKHFPTTDQEVVDGIEDAAGRQSSTSSTPAHPGTTSEGVGRAGQLRTDEDGVGSSSAVRFRSAPGEMSQGGEGGLGLMRDGKKTDGGSS